MTEATFAASSYEAWFRAEVQAGMDAANVGKLLDADEVEAEAAAWRAAIRSHIAKADTHRQQL